MLFLDLFAGIGGFRLGMEAAGHKCVGHCEIDKYANIAYAAIHQPEESEWFATDITAVRARDLPAADVWCFGFPCQDISVAGRQQGLSGRRSGLFYAVTELIRGLEEKDRPKLLFIENVKNLLSVNRGYDFLAILAELAEIGYDAEWQVINSADYVPQNRERVYLIGHLRGRGTRQVLPLPGADGQIGIKQLGNCMPTKTRSNPNQGRVYDPSGLAPTLNKMDGGGREPLIIDDQGRKNKTLKPTAICPALRAQTHGNQPLVFIDLCPNPKKTSVARTITARYNKGFSERHGELSGVVVPVITPGHLVKRQNGPRFRLDGADMYTLTSQGGPHGIYDGCRIRKLTPRECWRLQGFPDWSFDRAQAAGLSDTQLYKQAGNSVTVDVICEIAKRLVIDSGD